ncbi:glutamate synthase subunit beta [Chitinophaga sancti]|uniref:Glutamate synthase (NADPH/NADH) small chain n=1 Tax=Chitinophaga sancti TaxID=1004 RepID=A0A1K1P3U8_9BACT|nr:glutamate synthase subunit beta [Chitinophaga sancti]WQD60445.1 glutamate synthase subunit beta [Chitinophaga sancti]WQG87427.1 glutamate synthase subunit beta [Chitinophaga sancti]SFW42133.1 glutamate synthase (NADPH/NADH) small chain [Chitinophaga sancti]
MGKPTGFLEFTRELPGKKAPRERVRNYNEFVERLSDTKLNEQSARCMNCGVPFCHSGCPLGNIIPEFNDAVYHKDWKEAYEILTSTNNFPEFTGRICPAPCESACVLGINQPPVAIEEIERHIIEIAFDKGLVQAKTPRVRTGKKVAVIGSGPAGLAAAAQLNYAGHQVTVFERDDVPGGLLRYGIPDFKLEKWVIDRRVKVMEEEGVTFQCNANVGVNVSVNDLLREYNAIVLAGGSTIPRDLNIPGRQLKGVHYAMDFLKQQNKRVGNRAVSGEDIMATDKNVVVIGGGDTGSDCVGTSNRHGAKSITQIELMPKPPGERTPYMPWPTYPMVLKTTSSHEEGADRHWAIGTKEFVGDSNGNLKGLKLVDLQWSLGVDGRPGGFTEVPGSEREVPCELAFLAMGFLHPQHTGLLDDLGVEKDERGNVKAGEKAFQTSIPKVFAAGDMRRGQSLVVWAISEGRECARKVDEFLMGVSQLESKDASLPAMAV